jgi:anhydro-N-acetylmuramic acid kinase
MRVAGVMTGTSGDGVDGVVVRLVGAFPDLEWELLETAFLPLPSRVREIIEEGARGSVRVESYQELESLITRSTLELLFQLKRRISFDLVGIHGQTIWHLPRGEPPFTHQVMNPYPIVEALGVPVVWDFRRADLAVGGEGAPLTPLALFYLFYPRTGPRCGFLNLGGIANYTYFSGENPEDVLGWDTGPGMSLVDLAVRIFFQLPYDPEGKIALRGSIHRELLDELLRDPYFGRTPPKSTGKERFGPALLDGIMTKWRIEPEDLLATLSAFTAESAGLEIKRFSSPYRVYLYGGGSRNRAVTEHLARTLEGVEIVPLDPLGVPPQSLEALAFALLAYERWHGRPGNLPQVTGAKKRVLLGAIAGK